MESNIDNLLGRIKLESGGGTELEYAESQLLIYLNNWPMDEGKWISLILLRLIPPLADWGGAMEICDKMLESAKKQEVKFLVLKAYMQDSFFGGITYQVVEKIAFLKKKNLELQHILFFMEGKYFENKEEAAKAIPCFDKASELFPSFSRAHEALGDLLSKQGNKKLAYVAYQKAVLSTRLISSISDYLIDFIDFQKFLDEEIYRSCRTQIQHSFLLEKLAKVKD